MFCVKCAENQDNLYLISTHYANIVWDSCCNQLTGLLESVQYWAAKIITDAIHQTSPIHAGILLDSGFIL